jgi:hypothetical protein
VHNNMSDGLDNLLGDSDSGTDAGNGGGNLRKLLEQALQREKAANDRLAQLEATQRQGQLASLLEKHAVPTLAADFFPKDAELNDEAITAFVGKYGQLWGHQAAPATTPPEQQAATQVIQQVTSQATTPPAGVPLTEEQYRQKFADAKSPDELMQLIAQLGA